MLHLSMYKPLIGLRLKKNLTSSSVNYIAAKTDSVTKKALCVLKKHFVFSEQICFFTKKYKTQLNVLKQSRFALSKTLTFNKDHTWVKYSH